jgi:glycosyltransferase involved in cell wall biosynthesis
MAENMQIIIVNMGLLYARCIGTLSAKGKYILPMDSDDMFLDEDVLFILTNIISKGNFDIIIYNSISTDLKPNVYTTKFAPTIYDYKHKPNLVLFQPNLGYYHIAPSTNLEICYFNDELIHGKLFKTKVYKTAVNKLGKERYSRYMIIVEDDIVNNVIFNIAKSAKFIAKYGYLYINNEESHSKRQKDKVQKVRNYLYLLDPMIDFTLDIPRNKKVLANFIIFLFKQQYLKDLLNTEYDNKLFISCLDRIFKCKYISDKFKNEIRTRGKNLNFIKYNF